MSNGSLIIESPIDTTIMVTSVDGRTRYINVCAGTNNIDYLSSGFYIINRRKVIIR